jgi:putative aldouronate transport system permease protein
MGRSSAENTVMTPGKRFKKGLKKFRAQIGLQAMVIPGIIWIIIFCYIPMYGIIIAFKEFKPILGLFGGEWVGFKHFSDFFTDPGALRSVANTIGISVLKFVVGFPAPIIFALLLNEIVNLRFKKFAQSVSYLPYFISWVILASMMKNLLDLNGPINTILIRTGILKEGISFLTQEKMFWGILVISDLWKGVGWSSIIYIAAISGINPVMYESALIDGAKRYQRILYITIPSIMPTITILMILGISGILGSNFDQHYLLGNAAVADVAETIDTYVFRMGLSLQRYSYATAVGLSRSVVSFILLFAANKLIRKLSNGEHGIFS